METLMKGVVLTGHGGLEMLEWRDDLPLPTPGPAEVRIRLGAAAVNNTDVNTRLAWYSKGDGAGADATWSGGALTFPHIQGIDGCGTIEAVGTGINPKRIGERVLIEPCLIEAGGAPLPSPWFLGSECPGTFAEYTCVAARHAHPIASPLSDVELASFPCSYSTAENMLTRAGAGPGDRILVTGASGGVGSAAIQLAQARGAEVVAVSQPSKASALKDLGASEVVCRDTNLTEHFGSNAFSLVIDLVGGPAFAQLLQVLRPHGRYAVSGAVAGAEVPLDLRTLYLKDQRFFGCTHLDAGVFSGLLRYIESGAIHPLLAATYPLKDIRSAQEAFLKRRHIGKIGLHIS